jgi:hypothetical protein
MVHIGISNPLTRWLPEMFVHSLSFLGMSLLRGWVLAIPAKNNLRSVLFLRVRDSAPLYKLLM